MSPEPSELWCWHDAAIACDVPALLKHRLAGLDAYAIAIAVAVGDKVEFACRGRLGDERVDARTVFYGASITKQIMGVLPAQAVLDESVHPDDCLVDLLPKQPDWMESIRLHHLIHHTSDLPDVTDPALGIPSSNHVVIARLQGAQSARHHSPASATPTTTPATSCSPKP